MDAPLRAAAKFWNFFFSQWGADSFGGSVDTVGRHATIIDITIQFLLASLVILCIFYQ